MIIAPTPFFGWNAVYKGPINHFAMSGGTVNDGGVIRSLLNFRVSSDGLKFYGYGFAGDLSKAIRSNAGGGFGAFVPSTRPIKVGSLYILVGRMWDNSNNSRAAIFTSPDRYTWTWIPTSIDGTAGSSGDRSFVDVAANASYVVALSSTGERAVSTDGGLSFTGYGNIGFTGTQPAKSIAASTAGFVAVGMAGQLFTVTDPRTAWTSRVSQFGSDDITKVVAGNVFCAVGGSGKISTCPLTVFTTWTAVSSGTSAALEFVVYGNSTWFAAGPAVWLTSATAASWSAPVAKPGGGDFSRARSGYYSGGVWRIHWGDGQLSTGNGTTWAEAANNGLATAAYLATSAA